MLHQDAVCPAFDSTLGTHRLDLKFHAPRSRQNLSRDPRSLSKTLHLVNTIAQASSAWRPKGKFIQSIFFVANDYIMSIMRPDPLPGENAALWSFSQVGAWGGGLCRGRLLINHLLVCWCKFSPRFEFRLMPELSVWRGAACAPEGTLGFGVCLRVIHRRVFEGAYRSTSESLGLVAYRSVVCCAIFMIFLTTHPVLSWGKKKKKWLSSENSKVSLIVWFPSLLFFHFLYFLWIFLFACSNNMRRHQQKWKRTCFSLGFFEGKGGCTVCPAETWCGFVNYYKGELPILRVADLF